MDLVIRRELWGGGDLGNSWSGEELRKDGENEGQEEEGGKEGISVWRVSEAEGEGFFYPEYTSYWTPRQETAAIIDANCHVFSLSQL